MTSSSEWYCSMSLLSTSQFKAQVKCESINYFFFFLGGGGAVGGWGESGFFEQQFYLLHKNQIYSLEGITCN